MVDLRFILHLSVDWTACRRIVITRNSSSVLAGRIGSGIFKEIKVAKQIKPDVITLDLSMPVMNGLTRHRSYEKASRKRRSFCLLCMEIVG
jgi:CheY-like chemotaxis protein